METPGPAVLLVDDDDDLRATLQDLMNYFGVRSSVSAFSLDDVARQRAAALQCKLAILDINLGEGLPTGVHVYHWLKREGFPGNIVFLTGHAADDPRVVEAARLSDSRVFSKPLNLAELKRLVEELGQGP